MDCPTCNGTGIVTIVRNADSTSRAEVEDECIECDGTGVVCEDCGYIYSDCICFDDDDDDWEDEDEEDDRDEDEYD